MNSMLYPKNTASRVAMNLSGMWKIKYDFDQEGKEQEWKNGLDSHDYVPVPSSFNDLYTDKNIREYAGDIWYETELAIPELWKGRELEIRFGSATHRATVYFNGVEVGSHEGGFMPFCVPITENVLWNQKNKIVVCVNNELNKTTVPVGNTRPRPELKRVDKSKDTPSAKIQTSGGFDFFNYAGLQRPVWLNVLPQTRITDFTVVHELQGDDAIVHYEVETLGEAGTEAKILVYDEEGRQVAEAAGAAGDILVKDVRLWNVLDAYLYRFVIRLEKDGQLLDEYEEEIGIRTVAIRGTEILINGKPVYLKGFGKHEDADIIGRGFSPAVMKRDFELMKWIGANSFRTSHYPYNEEVYQMADREGFLVIDEVAAVGMITYEGMMMFAGAGVGAKPKSFFTGPEIEKLRANHIQSIQELIKRDKNHACVFSWSLFNEPETFSEEASEYFGEMFAVALEADPQKRPRTFAMEKSCSPQNVGCHKYCDFLTMNRYYGWYISGGYGIDWAEEQFREEMDQWAALPNQRPMVFTEYGTDTLPTEHKLPSVMWGQEYQVEMLRMCHGVFDDYDFVKGEQVWNFADFQTGEGTGRVNGNKKGVFTRQRQPKDSAFYLKERWDSLPLDFKAEK